MISFIAVGLLLLGMGTMSAAESMMRKASVWDIPRKKQAANVSLFGIILITLACITGLILWLQSMLQG